MVYLPKMKTHAAHLHTAQSGVYLPACRIDTFAALKHFFNVSLTMSSLILYGRCWVGASAPQPTAADSPHADAETICKLDPEKKKEQQPTAQQLSLSYLSSPSHTRQIHFSLRAVGYANVQSQPCLLPFRLCDPRVCLRLSKCGAWVEWQLWRGRSAPRAKNHFKSGICVPVHSSHRATIAAADPGVNTVHIIVCFWFKSKV
jgi:hypothetical protein